MKIMRPIAALLALTLVGTAFTACGKKNSGAFSYSDGLDDNGFFTGVKAVDLVALPKYKGIEVDKAVFEASEEDVNAQIELVLEGQNNGEHIMDRAIVDGDTVNIDYVGSVGGVEFEGGNTGGSGTVVTIGVTSYIDDFLEQLIGHKPGDKFDIEVTFPDPYQNNPDLAGKDAVFSTTVNYILGESKLTEEVAASYGFDSIDAMLEDVRNWLLEQQSFKVLNEVLVEAEVAEIPQSVLDFVINYDIYQLETTATMYGMTAADLLSQFYGYESVAAYRDANLETYRENAAKYLAAQAIAELEGISVTDEDIKNAGYTDDEIAEYGKPYLKQYLMFQQKLPKLLLDNAVVK